ncbi:MAG TPA: hypothetical protein VFR38_11915 [Gaiellaceae bacterium]|nr:hypothetical protein [Gaiellaceae bacterium]
MLRKEALGRAALVATRRGPSRLLAEGIVRAHCETIEATQGIPADEVWAEFSTHLDMDELGAIYASKIPEELEQRAETGDPAARREYAAIVTTELRDALERHGGDTSLLADAP